MRYVPPSTLSEAWAALIDDGAGLLGSEGSGVYHSGVEAQQTGLAPRSHTARGLTARPPPERAACGAGALVEWHRLEQMAKAPPPVGQWRA